MCTRTLTGCMRQEWQASYRILWKAYSITFSATSTTYLTESNTNVIPKGSKCELKNDGLRCLIRLKEHIITSYSMLNLNIGTTTIEWEKAKGQDLPE